MKYKKEQFDQSVKDYINRLDNAEEKSFFITMDLKNKDAFYSIAPLSRALDEINADLHVVIKSGENKNIEVLKDIWNIEENEALDKFIETVNKRTKKEEFKEIFQPPEFILEAKSNSFKGKIELPFHTEWLKEYRFDELKETAERIWKKGYALKPKENVKIGFTLIPAEDKIELPLEDYLDSYQMTYALGLVADKLANPTLSSSSDRESRLEKPVRTLDLAATIKGCQLEKDIDEPVFQAYKKFSESLNLDRLEFSQAGFGIKAKGYFGKHFFGEEIGYPTENKESRWSSPGQMMLKDKNSPQSLIETRDPMMRYAITETLPIDTFIKTCNVDYEVLRKKSSKIRDIFNSCEKIKVRANKEKKGYRTKFTVQLTNKNKRRYFIADNSDVRNIIDPYALKVHGEKFGSFANFPSGETFVTPESIEGTMVGDVVINVDRSRVIPKDEPIIVKFKEGKYEIISAPKDIKKAMDKELAESEEQIKNYEKNESLPKDIIQSYKDNFKRIGEFAVNTNPKAKLCNYLIVNEKIARMIHVALGMGFAPDRKTLYHWDIVVDSPDQQLDIYGIDKENNKHWIIKKGEFVV